MWFEILVLGSMPFWFAVAALYIFYVYLIEHDAGGGSSLLTLGALAFTTLFTAFNPFMWVYLHPVVFFTWAAGYIVVGIAWGFIKWFFYLLNVSHRAETLKAEFLKIASQRVDESPTTFINRMMNSVSSQLGVDLPPKISKNKARLITWMTFWWVSMPWTVLNDPIKHLWRFVYARLQNTLQAMSNHVFRDFKKIEGLVDNPSIVVETPPMASWGPTGLTGK